MLPAAVFPPFKWPHTNWK